MKKFYNHIDEYACAILLIVMCIITFINVLSRYVLHMSISASEEIATLLFIPLSLLGASVAQSRKAHLGLTILTDHLPAKAQKCCELFGCVLSIAFCSILGYEGILMVINEKKIGVLTLSMNWPEWIFCMFIPMGCAFIIFRLIQQMVNVIKNFNKVEEVDAQ